MKKKSFFLLLALVGAAATGRAEEVADTTVIDDARRVMVITTDSVQHVKVVGRGDDDKYVYENSIQLVDTNYVSETRTYRDLRALDWSVDKKDNRSTNTLSLNFGFGFSAPTHVPAGMSLAPMRCPDAMLWLLFNHTPRHRLQTYSIGFGMTGRNYGLHSGNMFMMDQNGLTGLSPYPEGASSCSSSVNVFSLSVPMLFTQKFGRKSHFKLSVGPVLNFNVGGTLNNRYTIGDNEYNITTHHIGQRPVTVDFMGMLRVYGFGFYLKFSPQSVFKPERGPQFRALSFGLFL